MKESLAKNDKIVLKDYNGLEYIQFKNLLKYDAFIQHCFSTRIGGVSNGECFSLNFGFNRNDARENVLENFKRISAALDINYENMVFSNQVHDDKVREVTENDRGKGIIIKSDIIGYDGLITNVPDVTLVTFYADCVPLFFLDPEKKVIALSHSGWRGTVKRIALQTINKMVSVYGSNIENIEVAVGPSIGACCFEVGDEVYYEFKRCFEWCDEYCQRTCEAKWNINLQGIIARTLSDEGICPEKICLSGICTKCNNDVFYSHRGDNGKTGILAAIMQIRSCL